MRSYRRLPILALALPLAGCGWLPLGQEGAIAPLRVHRGSGTIVPGPPETFRLHAGQTQALPARPGDVVICTGNGNSVRLRVGRPSSGKGVSRFGFGKTLTLSLESPGPFMHAGTVVATCTSR